MATGVVAVVGGGHLLDPQAAVERLRCCATMAKVGVVTDQVELQDRFAGACIDFDTRDGITGPLQAAALFSRYVVPDPDEAVLIVTPIWPAMDTEGCDHMVDLVTECEHDECVRAVGPSGPVSCWAMTAGTLKRVRRDRLFVPPEKFELQVDFDDLRTDSDLTRWREHLDAEQEIIRDW